LRQLSLELYYGTGDADPRQKMDKDAYGYLALLHSRDAYANYCQMIISNIASYTSKTVPQNFQGRKCVLIGYQLVIEEFGSKKKTEGGNLWVARFEGEAEWYVLGLEQGAKILN